MDSQVPSILPKLSVVVCTFQRPDHLARLLNTLNMQTASKQEFEVLVVDNETSSNSSVMALCASSETQGLAIRYFHHARTGVSSARNRGVQEACADWVAFLDDDIVLPPEWVARELQFIKEGKAEIFGGPGTPFYTSIPPKWFKDSYAGLKPGREQKWLDRNKPLAGYNFTCRRELILRLGGFSECFGYVGEKKRFGEDNDFCQRAQDEGIGLWFDPELTVQHHFEAERMTVRWQLNAITRHSQMKAHILLRESKDTRPVYRQTLSIMIKLLHQSLQFLNVCFSEPFRNRKKYPYPENYTIEKIGPKLRQVALLFEMMNVLLFHPQEIQGDWK